jgi:hypothetical protein
MINNTGKPSTGPVASLQSAPSPGTLTVRFPQVRESMWSVMSHLYQHSWKGPHKAGLMALGEMTPRRMAIASLN